MNPERLLQNFARLIDTPDAVPRLRRFILDLAVRGKLVEQNPEDEPAVELLKIATESVEALFELPNKWVSARAGSLLNIQYGKARPAKDRSDQGRVPVYGSNGIVGYCEGALSEESAIIIGRKGSAGALNLCDGPSWTTDVAYFSIPPAFFNIRFLLTVLQTLDLGSLGKGVKPGLNRGEAYQLLIMVPPLAEQHRIVAKVDELMKLCDELEAAQAKRERRRDRLVAATLHGLNNGSPESETKELLPFKDSARFYFNHLPRLTTRPEHIQQLRQTILNLAVRGKLVHQDPKDEPASELLKQIEVEKFQRFGSSNKKNQTIDEDQIPSAIPDNWQWTQLARIGVINPRNDAEDSIDASFVPMPLIFAKYGRENQHEVRPWSEIKKGFTHFAEGDVGLAKITPCFENGKSTVFRNLTGGLGAGTTELHIVRPVLINPDYILIFLKSPYFIGTGIPKMTGTAGQKRVPKDYFAFSPFPLPPLAEQHRIVAKVNELMALCDEMESRIATNTMTSRKLLEATLQEAIN